MERIRNIIVYLICAFLGIVVGVLAFNYVVMPFFVGRGKTIEIPNVIGMDYVRAESLLTSLEFRIEKMDEEFSDSIPEGHVTTQIPHPQSYAKKGRMVRVSVSLGGEMIPVPDLVGFSLRQAEIRLERQELTAGEIDEEYSGTIFKDNVISTDPIAGELVPPGTAVDLTISLGRKSYHVNVPNFIGRQVEEVEELAENAGIKVVINYRKIPAVAPNTIYQQSETPGTTVPRGTEVVLIANMKEE
ncbi:PASTA domain-containing protein [bacterium]|nr:PASTA domain-containing protein [bacterium]